MWPDLKKTQLPHTQYQTYDFTWNELLAQYTIIFHCWPCSKPRVWFLWQLFLDPVQASSAFWRHWMVIALLYWHLEGWTSHKGLANVCYLQFGVLWAQERSSRAPNWTSPFQSSSYFILYSYIKPTLFPPPTTPITTTCNIIIITKKAAQNSLYFGCLKVSYSPTQL